MFETLIVHQAKKEGSIRTQKVEIYFNFVGEINLQYSEEELLEIEAEKEERLAQKKESQKERNKKFREQRKAERYAANDGHKYAKHICEHCGEEYWPNVAHQKYCCKECGKKGSRVS